MLFLHSLIQVAKERHNAEVPRRRRPGCATSATRSARTLSARPV